MAGRKAKQRLFDIITGEVSLVDFPANEAEFLVVKRREGLKMGVKKAGANPEGTAPAPNGDSIAGIEDLIKVVEELTSTLTGGSENDEVKKGEEGEGEPASGNLPPKIKGALVQLYRLIGQALGTTEPAGEEKKKSEGGDKGVEKGGKRLNVNRKTKIVTALKELIGLMQDLDPDALSDLLTKQDDDDDDEKGKKGKGKKKDEEEEQEKGKKTPKGKTKGDEEEDEEEEDEEKGKKTKKNIEGLELIDTLKGVIARVERVESATGVSKVEKAEGDPVEKDEDFWQGVL